MQTWGEAREEGPGVQGGRRDLVSQVWEGVALGQRWGP